MGNVFSIQNVLHVANAGSVIADANDEALRLSLISLDAEAGAAAAGVFVGVARQLGYRRSHPRLVLCIESQELGNLSRPLTGEYHVVLVSDLEREQRGHGALHSQSCGLRRTSTVASSRARVKSRKSVPATRAGWCMASPGYASRRQRLMMPSECMMSRASS